jgi:hypothetical protein
LHPTIQGSSISRALTNLKDENKVIKLPMMRMGAFGKLNHLWQYNNKNVTQLNLFEEGGANE